MPPPYSPNLSTSSTESTTVGGDPISSAAEISCSDLQGFAYTMSSASVFLLERARFLILRSSRFEAQSNPRPASYR